MKVLVVEDAALLREKLRDLLADISEVSLEGEAESEAEAVALLKTRPFDLLLTDIELDGGNGFEVIKFILSDAYPHPKPICLILTNHSNAFYLDLAKDLHVEYFFDKSLDFDLAIDAIETEAKKFASR